MSIGRIDGKFIINPSPEEIEKSDMSMVVSGTDDSVVMVEGVSDFITEEDVYNHKNFENDALFKIEIRKKFREIINLGFCDAYRYINENKNEYTFWDYMRGAWPKNLGMRIDHFLISSSMLDKIKKVNINKNPRSKLKPSDHTPIEININ